MVMMAVVREDDRGPARTAHPGVPTYYVDPTSRHGTCHDGRREAVARNAPHRPFCSVEAAVMAARPGTVIALREGAYPPLRIDRDASKQSLVTIRPAPGESVRTSGIHIDGADNWGITGLEITGYRGREPSPLQGRIHIESADGIRIAGNHIHDSPGGVYYRGGVRDLVIAHNRMHRLSCVRYAPAGACPRDKLGYGIANGAGDAVALRIVGNLIKDVDGDGIQLGACRGCVVDRNHLYDIYARAGNDDHADAIQMSGGGENVAVTRNVMHHASKCFITGNVSNKVWRNWRFERNLCFDTANYCFSGLPPADGLLVRRNTCWDNRRPALSLLNAPQRNNARNIRVTDNVFGPCGDCTVSTELSPRTPGVVEWQRNLIAENGAGVQFAQTDIVAPPDGELARAFPGRERGDFRPGRGTLLDLPGDRVLGALDVPPR